MILTAEIIAYAAAQLMQAGHDRAGVLAARRCP